jgi:hypothetical protein
MKPIAVFYHTLFVVGNPPQPMQSALQIIPEQMVQLVGWGLLDAATEFHVGVNGGEESKPYVSSMVSEKADVRYHGLDSRCENLTIVWMEEWVKTHPDWYVFYHHVKGAGHDINSSYFQYAAEWRRGMAHDLIINWRQCVADLDAGHDIACSHFMRHVADGTQNIAAGNFWWAKSDFIATLPSIFLRDRIKQDGIGALTSKYEAEVWIGNGKMPNAKEYRPGGGNGVP